METNNDASSVTVCEKLCSAITESASFRAIGRALSRSQDSNSVAITPDSSLSTPKPSSQMVSITAMPPAQPGMISVDKKGTPLEFEVPIYKNNQVPVTHSAVERPRQPPLVGAKAKYNTDPAETSVQIVSRWGHSRYAEEEARASKVDRAADVASKIEPEPRLVPLLEKTKSKKSTASPTKRVLNQRTKSRSESTISATPMLDEKPKPKTEKIPSIKSFGGRDDALVRNEPEDQNQDSKDMALDINHRVSIYISRAKLRIGTMSNSGGTEGSPQKDTAEKDTKLDDFGNYINRAKMKLRAMSSFRDSGDIDVQRK